MKDFSVKYFTTHCVNVNSKFKHKLSDIFYHSIVICLILIYTEGFKSMYQHNVLQMNNPMINSFFVEIRIHDLSDNYYVCFENVNSCLFLFVSYFSFPKFPSSLFSIYFPPSRIQKSHSSSFRLFFFLCNIIGILCRPWQQIATLITFYKS